MDLSKLSKIRADKLFPEFLSEEDKRQISLIRAKSKRRHEELHEGEDRRANIISEGEFNLQSIVGDLIDPKTGKMRELVDTRDLAEAKNFYDYCYRILGSDIHAPWAVQMWLAAMSLGEVCPKCTNPKYLDVRNIDKSLDSRSLNHPKRMTFLEHGVCPRCGATKRDLIQSGLLPTINQAVWTLGQRCVTADTALLTDNGIEYIGDLLGDYGLGYSVFSHLIHNGTRLERTSLCFVAKPESLLRVTLEDGGYIECTKDHPLMTFNGWKQSKNLSMDDYIEIAVNTQCFGAHVPTWDTAIAYAYANAKGTAIDSTKATFNAVTGKIGKDFFTLLGLWVAEGRSTVITQKDKQVSKFIRLALTKVFATGYHYSEKDYRHAVRGHYAYSLFRFFFGDLDKGSYYQEIPKCVLSAPRDYVCRFLRGMYEGDGYIDKKGAIHYYTVSEHLAQQLRTVLYNLGFYPTVSSQIKTTQNGTETLCYIVSLSRYNLSLFAHLIGFISRRKNGRMQYFLTKKYQNNCPFIVESCPPALAQRFADFVDACINELKETYDLPPTGVEVRKHSHHYTRYAQHVALYQFFGLGDYGCYRGCSTIKRWRKGLYINRSKIVSTCQHIKDNYLSCISYGLQRELDALLELAQHYFVKIKSINAVDPKPTYDLVLPETHRFIGNAIVNHNSGKSSTAAVVASYVLHRYLMYPLLASMTTSMQASTELVMIFCSLSYDKAVGVLWTPFKNIIDQSQWYKSYFALLDTYGQQYGKELYTNSKSLLAFGNKNIRCYPTGPKASALRGNTSIMTLMDELGLFPLPDPGREVSEDDTNRRADSDEAYTSLLNSLATVGAAQKELITKGNFDAPPCLMLSVSSPISKRDKVMRLLEESKTNPYIFGAQLATWEVNPFLDRDSPLIASAFAANERRALRDFGAIPTETSSPFFDDNVIDLLFTGRPNSHVMQYVYSNGYVWGKIRQVNQYDQPTVIALDAGLVNNSFAIVAVGYDKESQTTQTVCALEVMATGSQIIDFQQVYSEIILPLAQALNCVLVVADRWNSVDHLHRIRADRGERNKKPITQGKQYSLKLKDFEAVRTMIQVTLEDAQEADEIFSILMGDKVEPRREFIMKNAKFVENLDI